MEEGRRFAAYWKSVDTSFDETEITGKEVDPYVLRSVDAGIDAPYSFEHENLDPATSYYQRGGGSAPGLKRSQAGGAAIL